MRKLYLKLVAVIAISAFVFTFSSAYADKKFHQTIVNNTTTTIYVTPTHNSRVNHLKRFWVTLSPGEEKTIDFSVEDLSTYTAYIDQHISNKPPFTGKTTKCFKIQFYTFGKGGDGASDKNRIRDCGTKDSIFAVQKSGNHEHYTIYVYYNQKMLKLKNK